MITITVNTEERRYKQFIIKVNGIEVVKVRKEYVYGRLMAIEKTLEALGLPFKTHIVNRRNKLDKSKADEILASVAFIGQAKTAQKYGVTRQAITAFCKLLKTK